MSLSVRGPAFAGLLTSNLHSSPSFFQKQTKASLSTLLSSEEAHGYTLLSNLLHGQDQRQPGERQSRKVRTEQASPLLARMNTQWWMQWRQNQSRAYGIRKIRDCRQGPTRGYPRALAALRESGVKVKFPRSYS